MNNAGSSGLTGVHQADHHEGHLQSVCGSSAVELSTTARFARIVCGPYVAIHLHMWMLDQPCVAAFLPGQAPAVVTPSSAVLAIASHAPQAVAHRDIQLLLLVCTFKCGHLDHNYAQPLCSTRSLSHPAYRHGMHWPHVSSSTSVTAGGNCQVSVL